MWWQQLHASEGWCGVKEVAVEGRLARCQPPIRVFWDGTAPVHGGHLMANFSAVKKQKDRQNKPKKHSSV